MSSFDDANEEDEFSDEIEREYDYLDQEKQDIIREYREGAVDRNALDHLNELIGSVRDTEGKLGEALKEKTKELEEEINNLKKEVSRVDEEAEEVRELEEIWEEFERAVNGMLGGARLDDPGVRDKLKGVAGDVLDGNSSAYQYSDNVYEDEDFNKEKDSDVLKDLISKIESEYLNPILSQEENRTDEEEAFNKLLYTSRSSVRLHQDATKVKHILLRAKRDTDLQKELIQDDSRYTKEINKKVKEADREEKRLDRLAANIAETEDELINQLEEAVSIIKQIAELDRDTINMMRDGLTEQKGIFSSLDISNGEHLIDKINQIAQKTGDQGFKQISGHLKEEFQPKVDNIISRMEQRYQEEVELAEEIESYIEEHKREKAREKEAKNDLPDIPVPSERIEDDASAPPPGTSEFIEVLESLSRKKGEIIEGARKAKKEYKEVYSTNQAEVGDVKNFTERISQFEDDIDELIKTVNRNYDKIQEDYAESPRNRIDVAKILTGEINSQSKGLKKLKAEISEIENHLSQIYEDEQDSKNKFRKAHNDIESELEGLEEIRGEMRELSDIISKLKENEGSDDRIRSYHQAILSASKSLYPSMDKQEAQKELIQFLDDLNEWFESINAEVSEIKEIELEVINEEKIEEKELRKSLKEAKNAFDLLDGALRGDEKFEKISKDYIPEDLAEALDKIEKELDSIEDKIGEEGKEIDQEKEAMKSDKADIENIEQELERAGAEVRALFQEAEKEKRDENY